MPQYALYFVPHELEREKLALLRRQLCKRFQNRKAVMYPVHMTLVRSLRFRGYKEFMAALQELCAQRKPIELKVRRNLASREGWGGVEIAPSAALGRLQQDLVALAQEQGEAAPSAFDPHISMVYARGLPSLAGRTSPVKRLLLDRVTLAIQTAPSTPFRVAKHVALGERPREEDEGHDDAGEEGDGDDGPEEDENAAHGRESG